MQLPAELQKAIEQEVSHLKLGALAHARDQLTLRYRAPQVAARAMHNELERGAYLLARLPATYAAVYHVLQASPFPEPIETLLDLGSGPGTALFAAMELWPQLQAATLLEQNPALLSLARRLLAYFSHPVVSSLSFLERNLEQVAHSDFPSADLLIFSYSIGEVAPHQIPTLVEKGWSQAKKGLIVIEPGTHLGFERIRSIRHQLMTLGAHLIAPCPHAHTCPMSGGDWCHFASRVERSSLHRRLKGGTLNYEDEKFSYLAVSKQESPRPTARILRHPIKKSGHVTLALCTNKGLQERTVSRRDGELYRQMRDAKWGDALHDGRW